MSAMGGAVEDKEPSLPVTIVMGTFLVDRSVLTLVELPSSFASMRSGISSSSMIKANSAPLCLQRMKENGVIVVESQDLIMTLQ